MSQPRARIASQLGLALAVILAIVISGSTVFALRSLDTANLATRAGTEGAGFTIEAPLIALGKAQIVREVLRLGVDFSATVSCYQADPQGRACGRCDACRLRAQGFAEAGVADPTRYR